MELLEKVGYGEFLKQIEVYRSNDARYFFLVDPHGSDKDKLLVSPCGHDDSNIEWISLPRKMVQKIVPMGSTFHGGQSFPSAYIEVSPECVAIHEVIQNIFYKDIAETIDENMTTGRGACYPAPKQCAYRNSKEAGDSWTFIASGDGFPKFFRCAGRKFKIRNKTFLHSHTIVANGCKHTSAMPVGRIDVKMIDGKGKGKIEHFGCDYA